MSRVEELRRADAGLIRALREARSSDEIQAAASEIYRYFLDTGDVNKALLRELLKTNDADEEQACILQLLGEVRDDDAFESFITVLEQYRDALNDHYHRHRWVPTKRITAAITFVRLIKIPDKALETTAKLVTRCVSCFDPPEEYIGEYKQFNLGALVTLGTISRLEWSYSTVRELLTHSPDYDVKSEAIGCIRQLVESALREGVYSPSTFKHVTMSLTVLLDKEQKRINNSSAIEVTPSERVVSGALLALTRVSPGAACARLMDLIMTAWRQGNDYLRGTFAQALKALPDDLRESFFSEAISKVPKEELARFLSFVFES